MDIFDKYIFEELTTEYRKDYLTNDDYEELYMRFCNIDHLDDTKPYLFTMRFLGLGTTATPDEVLEELKVLIVDNPSLTGLYYDLILCVDNSNVEALSNLKVAVEAGYSDKFLKDKSNIKMLEQPTTRQPKETFKSEETDKEVKYVDRETLTKDIVMSLIKKDVEGKAVCFRNLTLPSCYKKIGESAFQGVKDIDTLTIPKGYVEIKSNAFSWAIIHQVTVPKSVVLIGKNAFKGFTGVIECSNSSFAHEYAKRNNIRTLIK